MFRIPFPHFSELSQSPSLKTEVKRKRPLGVIIISIILIIRMLYLLIVDLPKTIGSLEFLGEVVYLGAMLDAILILGYLASSVGLLALKGWGRKLAILMSWLHLFVLFLFTFALAATLPIPLEEGLLLLFTGIWLHLGASLISAIIFTAYLTRPGVKSSFAETVFTPTPPSTPATLTAQPPTNTLRFCPFCGSPIRREYMFCTSCGKQLRVPHAKPPATAGRCPFCNAEVRPEDIFCPKCGSRIRD